jgi:hypothetical protein
MLHSDRLPNVSGGTEAATGLKYLFQPKSLFSLLRCRKIKHQSRRVPDVRTTSIVWGAD